MANRLYHQFLTISSTSLFAFLLAFSIELHATEIIQPNLDRAEKKLAKIDSENWEITPYAGLLAIEDFDSSSVLGVRLAYHLNESLFLEASGLSAKGDKTTFEELSSGFQLLTDDARKYTAYELTVGWNVLPSEVWLFGKAYAANFYLTTGAGSTEFGNDKWTTWVFGAGYRLFLNDWLTWRIDARDHIFNRDLFGEDDTTNNLEMSTGFSFFF